MWACQETNIVGYHLFHPYSPTLPPPPACVLKDLLPEHAELVAKCWNYWYFAGLPADLKTQYFRDLVIRYGAVGAFAKDDHTRQPIGWVFRKNGIIIITPSIR